MVAGRSLGDAEAADARGKIAEKTDGLERRYLMENAAGTPMHWKKLPGKPAVEL